jgi:hypothetical protein
MAVPRSFIGGRNELRIIEQRDVLVYRVLAPTVTCAGCGKRIKEGETAYNVSHPELLRFAVRDFHGYDCWYNFLANRQAEPGIDALFRENRERAPEERRVFSRPPPATEMKSPRTPPPRRRGHDAPARPRAAALNWWLLTRRLSESGLDSSGSLTDGLESGQAQQRPHQ